MIKQITLKSNKCTGYGLREERWAQWDIKNGTVVEKGQAYFGFDLTPLNGYTIDGLLQIHFDSLGTVKPQEPQMDLVGWPISTSAWRDQMPGYAEIPLDTKAKAARLANLQPTQSGQTTEYLLYGMDWNAAQQQEAVRYGVCMGLEVFPIPEGDGSRYVDATYRASLITHLGGWAPYIVVQAQETAIKATGLYPQSGASYMRGEAADLGWDIDGAKSDGGAVFGKPVYSHATVRWRMKDSTSFQERTVNNSKTYRLDTSGYNVGDTIEWQVTAYATTGASVTSDWRTINIKADSFTFNDLYPNSSSNYVYEGLPFRVQWKMGFGRPENRQTDALVRVRQNGLPEATTYRPQSGTDTDCQINGLKTGSWQWQVEVTDRYGTTKTSSWTTFTVQELVIAADNLKPEAGARAPRHFDNLFSWRVSIDQNGQSGATLEQKSAIFRWRTGEGAPVNETRLGAVQAYTLPAGKLPEKDPNVEEATIDWQVTIEASNGASSTSQWVTVLIDDAKPLAVIDNPIGGPVEDNGTITFSWFHVLDTETKPTGWEIELSKDAGARYEVIGREVDTDATSYVYDTTGKELEGNLMWRVRTRNSDGVWSEYSTARGFLVQQAAKAPSITQTDRCPLTILGWQSEGQQAYRVRIDDFDTGWRLGREKNYFHPHILADGDHTAQVQIMNASGSVSAEATTIIPTKNEPGEAPNLHLRELPGCVELTWGTVDGRAYVLRDGVPIAQAEGTRYVDYKAAGAHRYQLRVVKDRHYTDSAVLTGITRVEQALLTPLDERDFVTLELKRGGAPGHSRDLTSQVEYRHYFGREKPVKYVSGFVDATRSLSFTLPDPEDVAKVERWVGRDVLFKDCFGRLMAAGLDSISETLDDQADVDFSLTEFDFKEEVPYVQDTSQV